VTHHSLTRPVRTIQQGRAYVCTDAERDAYLTAAEGGYMAGRYTRPSGEPVPLERSSAAEEAAGWSQQQQAAALQLQAYWRGALPLRGLPGSYSGGKRGGGEISEEAAEEAQAAWNSYCEAMDAVRHRCSEKHHYWLREAVIYREGIRPAFLHLVREALSFLADEWRIDRLGRKRR
jgi:hypothetical protein